MQQAALRLFRSIIVSQDNYRSSPQIVESVMWRTIPHGYILDPRIPVDKKTLAIIDGVMSDSDDKADIFFRKLWATVKNTPIQKRFVQRIARYVKTRGFEVLVSYNKDTIYVPHKVLEIPEITVNIPLAVIKAMPATELLDEITALGKSVATLKPSAKEDVKTLLSVAGLLTLCDATTLILRQRHDKPFDSKTFG